MEFEFREEWKVEHDEKNDSTVKRMSEECLLAMNSINKDLKFTVETPEDFKNKREPTLDFEIWLEKGMILHNYFVKCKRP